MVTLPAAGDFVVFDWPSTDASATSKRAALVLSDPDSHGDVQLLKVTAKGHHHDLIAVGQQDMASGILKTTTYIRINRSTHCTCVARSEHGG